MSSTHVRPSFPRRLGTAVAAIGLSAGALGLYGSFAFGAACDTLTPTSSPILNVTVADGSTDTVIEYEGSGAIDVTQSSVCESYTDVATLNVSAAGGSTGDQSVTVIVSDTGLLPDTTISLGNQTDTVLLQGTSGNDTLDATDISFSGVENLDFVASGGNDLLVDDGDFSLSDMTFGGGGGTDTADLSARTGSWSFDMGDVEIAIGGSGANTITGNSSANTIYGGGGDDTLYGEGGVDLLLGEAGNDILHGGAANDTLVGHAGSDDFDGGDGTDTVNYNNSQYSGAATGGITFTLVGVSVQTTGGSGADQIIVADTVENLIGSSYGDDLTGNGGDNLIGGHLGNDTIAGGDGEDVLDGSTGVDTISYADSDAAVTVNLGAAYPTGGFAAGDLIGDFENAEGSDFADKLTGTSAANSLMGGDGNDTLVGLGGADTLNGGSGTHDLASYADSAAGVSVSLAAGSGKGGDAEGDKLSRIEDLIGSDEDDTLVGNRLANSLDGGDGDDFLSGDLAGDLLEGGDGSDTVSYAYSTEGVTVSLRSGTASGDGTGADTLRSIENVIGSSYADTLTGGDGKNVLNGGGGNDTLIALGGADRLYGSTGADTLNGGDGGDRLEGGGGADTIDGGSGKDVCKDGPGKDSVTNCEK